MTDELRALDRHILGEIWTSDESYRTLVQLCDDIGSRFAGSESEKRGAEFLASKMEEYGLENVRLEPFAMESWERGECALTLTAPVERDFSAIAMPYCPSAALEADVIDVGEGEEEDFARLGDSIRGKIVLTDAETHRPGERKSHRTDKFIRAIEYGAVACVFMNQNPGLLHITGSLSWGGARDTGREAPIPGIGISFEAGSAIRRLAMRGTPKLKIRTTNRTFPSTSYNVIGDIVGTAYPDEVIVIGGHFDGHDIAQGAGDDGAGVMSCLEAGRALAGLKGKLKRTIRIIGFGSEEVGLLGSIHHAEQNCGPDAKETYRFVLNMDGSGHGQGGRDHLRVSDLPEMLEYFQRVSKDIHYEFSMRNEFSPHSDHLPFALRGIPNSQMISLDASAGMVGRGWGHTEADTLDKVHLRGLQMSAVIAARLGARMSQDDEFPGRQRSIAEVEEQLERLGLLDRQKKSGLFPPS